MSKQRIPTTPGEILREEFLKPLNLTQKELADHLGIDVKVINRIVNGHAALTPAVALKLASALKTTAGFWLNAQNAVDLYKAAMELKHPPGPITRKVS